MPGRVLYYRGLGVEKDLAKALYWTQRAPPSTVTATAVQSRHTHKAGEGVEKNMDEAKRWCLLATAQQKHREAISKCRKFKIM